MGGDGKGKWTVGGNRYKEIVIVQLIWNRFGQVGGQLKVFWHGNVIELWI